MFKNISINKKAGLVISSISIISIVIGFMILNLQSDKIEKDVYAQSVKTLQDSVKDKFNSKKVVGISNAVSISNDGRIKQALSTGDRKLAIQTLSSVNSGMKKSTPFKNIKVHVHTKDNKSFVRAWKIKKFGDDLSGFRHSIVQVNKTQTAVNTFELGKAGLSLRSVIPVFDDNGSHLGSLEFMQGLNSVAKAFNKNGDGFLFLMDKRKSNVKTFEASKMFKTNYVLSQKFIKKGFLEDAKKINMDTLLKDKMAFTNQYLYTVVDVKDFRKETLGITIVASPLSKVNLAIDGAKELINIALMVIIGLTLLTLIFTILFINKIILNPLNNFQDGLLNFFKYLNRENTDVTLLDYSSNDEIGIMAKVVNENITKTKASIEEDNNLINKVKDTVNIVKTGDLTSRIKITTSNEALNELKDLINDMLNMLNSSIGKDINDITSVLTSYGKYDFRPIIKDANGDVAVITNQLGEMITQMLVENKKNGLILENYSDNLITNVEILNTSSSQQAASLEETAASIEEITSIIKQSSAKADEMTTLGEATKQSATTGKNLATQTENAMEEINTSTAAIEDAITVIDQIAFQTNILSLNAAVEAATAGEAGKGFAVVAGEVRNLATRSAEAANEIKALVSSAKDKADEGKIISTQMIAGYEELDSNIAKTAELISDVAAATREQLSGMNQINAAAAQLDQATQENANMASKTNTIAIDTDTIATVIVANADEKEFIGKDTIDISSDIKTSTVKAQPKASNNKAVNNKAVNNEAVNNEAVKVAPKVTKTANSNDDDEWDSF